MDNNWAKVAMYKKLLCFMVLLVTVAFASAQPSNAQPSNAQRSSALHKLHNPVPVMHAALRQQQNMGTKRISSTTVSLAEADYYGQDYLEPVGSEVEVDFYFVTDGLTLNEYFEPVGSGLLLALYTIAPSVDANLFPATGTYAVSDSFEPGTVILGMSSAWGYDGSLLYTVVNDVIESVELVDAGSVVIAGNAANATITMNLSTQEGSSLDFVFGGAVDVVDMTEQEEDAYALEPIIPKNVTITSNRIETEVYDDFFYLDIYDASTGYVANLLCNKSSSDPILGTYTVGSDPSDNAPGTIRYSAGVEGYNFYMSFVTGYDADGYVDLDHYDVFFITDGSLTLSQSGDYVNVQGTLGSYFGSTINISGSAVGIEGVRNAEVKLFPNPATTQLNVFAEGVKAIQVVDLCGRVVMERPQAGTLDVSPLDKGVYMVRVLTEKGVESRKFVKR